MPTYRAPAISVCALLVALATSGVPVAAQQFSLSGGSIQLQITSVGPGGQPVDVVAQNAAQLSWQGAANRKVTVETSCPGQSFQLFVLASNVTRGTASPERALIDGRWALDLITNIPNNGNGGATLRYRASARIQDGHSGEEGSDNHVVTYTVTAQ